MCIRLLRVRMALYLDEGLTSESVSKKSGDDRFCDSSGVSITLDLLVVPLVGFS